jgi:hypothetical protein
MSAEMAGSIQLPRSTPAKPGDCEPIDGFGLIGRDLTQVAYAQVRSFYGG